MVEHFEEKMEPHDRLELSSQVYKTRASPSMLERH